MSFFSNYVTVFKTKLITGSSQVKAHVPGLKMIWAGYYVSAKGSNLIEKVVGNSHEEGDRYGRLSLGTFLENNLKDDDQEGKNFFWNFNGWMDANGFKRLLLLISWTFSIPFLLTSLLLYALGSGFGAWSGSKKTSARMWAGIFMVPSLILVAIYRNIFDFSGRYPLQQLFLLFLLGVFIFVPTLHSPVGLFLQGGFLLAAAPVGLLPGILILTGILLTAWGLNYALSESDQTILDECKELRKSSKMISNLKTQVLNILSLGQSQKKIKEIKNILDNEIKFEAICNKLKESCFLSSNVEDLILALSTALINRAKLQMIKPSERLKLAAKRYSLLCMSLGMMSFALGLIGMLFLMPVNIPILAMILPYSLPLVSVIIVTLGFLAYKNANSVFFAATYNRKLFTLLSILTLTSVLIVAFPPVPLLFVAATGFTLAAVNTILSFATVFIGIGTILFYKTQIEQKEKDTYPARINIPFVNSSSLSHILERIGPPYGRVSYKKVGIEIHKKNGDVYEIRFSHKKKFYKVIQRTNKDNTLITSHTPLIAEGALQGPPYFLIPEEIKQQIKFSQKMLHHITDDHHMLLLDGTASQKINVTNNSNTKTLTLGFRENFITIAPFKQDYSVEHCNPDEYTSLRAAKAHLRLKEGFTGSEPGMEKLDDLGLYIAQPVKFDKNNPNSGQVVTAPQGDKYYCFANKPLKRMGAPKNNNAPKTFYEHPNLLPPAKDSVKVVDESSRLDLTHKRDEKELGLPDQKYEKDKKPPKVEVDIRGEASQHSGLPAIDGKKESQLIEDRKHIKPSGEEASVRPPPIITVEKTPAELAGGEKTPDVSALSSASLGNSRVGASSSRISFTQSQFLAPIESIPESPRSDASKDHSPPSVDGSPPSEASQVKDDSQQESVTP